MEHKKKLVVGAVSLVSAIIFLSMNIYTSSPGFVSEDDRETFFDSVPVCYGVSILLNKKATWGDAPGRSLCIGYLKYNELTQENLATIQQKIDQRNESKQGFPGFREEFKPTVVGTYNGIVIEERYWCNDSCPNNGIIYLNYVSSSEETCGDLGGNKLYKFGWGQQYIGCSPTENKFSD